MLVKGGFILFCLLGAAAYGFLGLTWIGDAQGEEDLIEVVRTLNPEGQDIKDLDNAIRAAYLMLVGGALAMASMVVGLVFRKRAIAGIVLLGSGGAPLIFTLQGVLFAIPLFIAGLIAFGLPKKADSDEKK